MPKDKTLRNQIKDADFVLRKVTGKGIDEYVRLAWNLLGQEVLNNLSGKRTAAPGEIIDQEDLRDCQLLGADNFYSEKVFHFAARVFRVENHPDKFLNPADKARQEEAFKQGEQAIGRICQRRGWKVP